MDYNQIAKSITDEIFSRKNNVLKSMKVVKAIILIFLSNHVCFAQIDPSIFDTSFECDVFVSYLNNPRDVLPHELLLALDYSPDDERFIHDIAYFANRLKEKVKGKSLNKKLKIIYKDTHDKFLRKYEDKSSFADILRSGIYNCVSATALYAIILERVVIDYEIRETPTHVYLIGDPENSGYLIETTLPSDGLFYFDDRLKRDYINFLNTNKIISNDEYKSRSIDELFQEYYLTDKKIDLIQLAGIQYYNKGIFEFNEEDFEKALKSFRKAEILYQSEIIRYMNNNSLLMVMKKQNQDKNYSVQSLVMYLNLNPFDKDAIDYAKYYFEQMSRERIVNHPNIETYQGEFDDLLDNVSANINLDLIYSIFYFYNAYYYSSVGDYSKALVSLEKLYLLNPENLEVKNKISESIIKISSQMGSGSAMIDSIDQYIYKFPFVLENKIIGTYIQYVYARMIYQYFVSNDSGLGFNYLIRLQSYLDNYSNIEFNEEYINLAYAEVGAYFVRKRKYQEAIKWLEKGLTYTPNSTELQGRLQRIKDYSKTKSSNQSTNRREESLKLYTSYLNRTRNNKETINAAFEKNIIGKWKLISTNRSSRLYKDDITVFHFKKNNIVNIYLGKEVEIRNWSYNFYTCKLTFINDEDEDLYFYIGEISDKKMETLMIKSGDVTSSMEMIFEAIK